MTANANDLRHTGIVQLSSVIRQAYHYIAEHEDVPGYRRPHSTVQSLGQDCRIDITLSPNTEFIVISVYAVQAGVDMLHNLEDRTLSGFAAVLHDQLEAWLEEFKKDYPDHPCFEPPLHP